MEKPEQRVPDTSACAWMTALEMFVESNSKTQ